MVELREARKAAAKIGLGLQYVLKEARVFDIWSKLGPIILSASCGMLKCWFSPIMIE